jgi:hypothetical protein
MLILLALRIVSLPYSLWKPEELGSLSYLFRKEVR